MTATVEESTKAELHIVGSNIDSEELTSQNLWIDPKREGKLLRKLDIWIAPVMTIIFLTAYLDRANIGNAASAGMVDDLGISGDELGSTLLRLVN